MTFRPRVTALEPEHMLEWSGTLGIQGLFDGRHTFILEPTEGGTTLTQTETFTGLLVPLTNKMLLRTKKGFENMNAALHNLGLPANRGQLIRRRVPAEVYCW